MHYYTARIVFLTLHLLHYIHHITFIALHSSHCINYIAFRYIASKIVLLNFMHRITLHSIALHHILNSFDTDRRTLSGIELISQLKNEKIYTKSVEIYVKSQTVRPMLATLHITLTTVSQ